MKHFKIKIIRPVGADYLMLGSDDPPIDPMACAPDDWCFSTNAGGCNGVNICWFSNSDCWTYSNACSVGNDDCYSGTSNYCGSGNGNCSTTNCTGHLMA